MPSKEQVRQWMQQRQVEHKPPPTPEQVRRELGWHMIVLPQKNDDR
ncbi:MAG: hypothetical protein ACXV99_12705 [Candidatus Angelobacter sp.]